MSSFKRCPNKNLPEWKMLLEQVGEDQAYFTYIVNNYNVPTNIVSLSKLRKDIKLPKDVHSGSKAEKDLNTKIFNYNKLHNTAHGFDKVQIGQSTQYEVVITPRYYPKNIVFSKYAKAIEELKADMISESELEFIKIYKKEMQEFMNSRTPGFSNTDNYSVDEEGNVIPPIDNDVDELIASDQTNEVARAEKYRMEKIDYDLRKARGRLHNADVKDVAEMRKILKDIEKYTNALNEAKERYQSSSEKIKNTEHVLQYADRQLDEVAALLKRPALSLENVLYCERIVSLWKRAGDFSSDTHVILDEDEANTASIKEDFRKRSAIAEDLSKSLGKLRKDHMMNYMKDNTSSNVTKEEIYQHIADCGWVDSRTKNLGRHGDRMLNAIFSSVEKASMYAQREANEIWQELESLTDKALPKLKAISGNKNPFRVLEQLTESGLSTGKIISRFSDAYYKERNKLYKQAFDKYKGKKPTQAEVKKYFKFLEDNTITFDVRMLFEDVKSEESSLPDEFLFQSKFTDAEKQAHIAELKHNLGEKGYEEFYNKVQQKIKTFQNTRDAVYEDNMSKDHLSVEERLQLFNTWLKENSPYWGIEMSKNESARKKPQGGFYKTSNALRYTYSVPRKEVNGKATKWHDSKFEQIEKDQDLLNYYNYIRSTLKQMSSLLPADKRKLLATNDIPAMKQTLVDQFSEKGLMMGIKPFWDKMIEMASSNDQAVNDQSDVDPLTGKTSKNLQIQFVEDVEQKVRDLVKIKVIKYRQENNEKDPSKEDLAKFREEARHEISQDKSFDLSKIIKGFSLMALGYKHKSIIEPQIRLAEAEFKSRKQIDTNKAGQNKLRDNVLKTTEGLQNYKDALDHFLDAQYYNIGTKKIEGVTNTRKYTSKEKIRKKEIEQLLEKATGEEKEFLERELSGLGSNVAMSNVGDMTLKFMLYKNLGWNIPSAVSNVMFGFISNLTEASGGLHYNVQNFRKAQLLTGNSVKKHIGLKNTTGLKIASLMHKWDLMQRTSEELFKSGDRSSMYKYIERFGPMSLQNSSEYLNNAPVMIAMMMQNKAKNANGEEVSMWEAYDEKGNLKEGYTIDLDEVRLFQKIRKVIEMNHGDYRNAMLAKTTFTGRALLMFRSWMIEGFANRFEKQKHDDILGYGNEEAGLRKGRYRSYTQGQLAVAGAALGTVLLPGVGTVALGAIGGTVGKFLKMRTDMNLFQDIMFTLANLSKKLTFGAIKTNFDDKFSKVDAANMRKNMTELYTLMSISAIILAITAAIGGDDDDEEARYQANAANFLLNQCTRMQTDIQFYTNPMEFDKLTKSAVPASDLIVDVSEWAISFKELMEGAEDENGNDITVFRSGVFKDESKFKIKTMEMIPGLSQEIKLERNIKSLFAK